MALAAVFFANVVSGQPVQPNEPPESSRPQSQKQQPSQSPQTRGGEASKDELKVEPSEAQKEVTEINRASNIIGMKVVNKQNEDIGRIKDLVVDFESGKIAYAVLSVGATLGVGGKLVAIPAESLAPQPGAKALLLDASKDRLAQAPGFDEDDWPRIDAASATTVGLSPTGRPSPPSKKGDPKSGKATGESTAEPARR
jgi:sporulation protein YlmC with PRC-barrel domain